MHLQFILRTNVACQLSLGVSDLEHFLSVFALNHHSKLKPHFLSAGFNCDSAIRPSPAFSFFFTGRYLMNGYIGWLVCRVLLMRSTRLGGQPHLKMHHCIYIHVYMWNMEYIFLSVYLIEPVTQGGRGTRELSLICNLPTLAVTHKLQFASVPKHADSGASHCRVMPT